MSRLRRIVKRCANCTQKIAVGALTLSLLLMFLSAVILSRSIDSSREGRSEVARMFNILALISETMEGVRTAESGQRGFLLTDKAHFLENYEEAVPRIRSKLKQLDRTVKDRAQRQQLERLHDLVEEKLAELAATINLSMHNPAAARTAVREGSGLEVTREIEASARDMREREMLLLSERAVSEEASLTGANAGAMTVSALSILSAVLGAVLLARMREKLARRKAEEASAAKSEFLATMSHEVRTPLNSVLGFTDLLLEQPELQPTTRQYVERVQTSGKVLLLVVNDILDFSKVEAGEMTLAPAHFSLNKLIDNTESMVRNAAESRGLNLRVTTDLHLQTYLLGDRGRIGQVLLNLLNNAIKFTETGEVTLFVRHTYLAGDIVNVRFAVRDTGIGIPKSKQHLLFRRFSQVDGSIHREFGGTGLGLAISQRLVQLMGGAIKIDSDEGQGSTFWFDIALAESTQATQPIPAPEAQTGTNARRRILVVDDVVANQELACAILGKAGHAAESVSSAAEAIQAVQASRYDLVLMDIQMPGMDGLAATREIRALGGEAGRVPIVALTANVLPQQIEKVREAGMNDFIGKPFNRDALLGTIDRWAARSADTAPVRQAA